mmetsp:Transcript_6057/g.7994  ORF Transcript_6057/g.7994 Transcript_6057/m.7994 type:complete len:96 (+) Transcript_6057:263-550(+)
MLNFERRRKDGLEEKLHLGKRTESSLRKSNALSKSSSNSALDFVKEERILEVIGPFDFFPKELEEFNESENKSSVASRTSKIQEVTDEEIQVVIN